MRGMTPVKTIVKVGLISLSLVALGWSAAPASAEEKPVATVNGKPIPAILVDAYAKRRPGNPAEVKRDELVNELVAQELLVQDAVHRGIDKDPELQAEVEVLRRGLLAGRAVKAYLAEHPISDEAMQAEYKVLAPRLATTEFKARHILLKSEDEAKAVIAELKKGADFAELAKTKSIGPSSKSGGDLGWFSADQMVKPFSDAVAGMEKGKYSAEPVQTQFGWHVILLEDTRSTPAPTFDAVKDQLHTYMEQKATQAYLKDLESKAKVER